MSIKILLITYIKVIYQNNTKLNLQTVFFKYNNNICVPRPLTLSAYIDFAV
jgi:hypothetical protein